MSNFTDKFKNKLMGSEMSFESRTKNSARNAIWSLFCHFTMLIFNFINRTVFIRVLGVDYLGVNGLFVNILTILSFAELGIGSAIAYNLYKPLAENDTERIKTLMRFYRNAYHTIGVIVTLAGLAVIPFLNTIIKEPPQISENLILIYIMFLADTSLSYFFVYKRTVIIADQKLFITSLFTQICSILRVVLQFVLLVTTRKYISYLAVNIIITLTNNLFVAYMANRMYPYLKDKNVKPLESAERKSIFKDVKALFMYKLSSVMLNGTDNIIISNIIGISAVGLCSNYILIIAIFTDILQELLDSFTASVGNLNAVERGERGEGVFKTMFFSCVWIYGFVSSGLLIFLNPLIKLWIGTEFLLSKWVVLLLVINFYTGGVHYVAYVFRTTMGFFVQGRYAPVAAAILNITLSIIWGKMYGVAGVFAATVVSKTLTIHFIDPILVYVLGFKKSPVWHYVKYFAFIAVFAAFCMLDRFIISFITIGGWPGIILQAIVFSIVFNLLMIIAFHRTQSFKNAMSKIPIVKNYIKIQ